MLREQQLFGERDLVALSIQRLREFETQACDMHPDGYWVAFSGGKDSIVILDLVRKAGVKHTAHFSVTTVDPPELLAFIREHYADVKREKPRLSMFQMIEKQMMPPTRMVRYCCKEFKERGGLNRFVVTGIRWAESVRRSKRRMTEVGFRDSRKRYLHPIIEWTDQDVWQYIRENKLPYCRLYDEGFTRVGCVLCPMANAREKAEHCRRWPAFERAYRRAMDKAVTALKTTERGAARIANSGKPLKWDNGDDMWDWWMREGIVTKKEDSDQGILFE